MWVYIQNFSYITGVIQPTAYLTSIQRMIFQDLVDISLSCIHSHHVLQILCSILPFYNLDEVRCQQCFVVLDVSVVALIVTYYLQFYV